MEETAAEKGGKKSVRLFIAFAIVVIALACVFLLFTPYGYVLIYWLSWMMSGWSIAY